MPPFFRALIACLLLLTGCRGEEQAPPAKPRVLVQPAIPAGASGAVFNGEIRARHEFDLAFRVGGKLVERLAEVGAEVKTGQTLARLDPSDLQHSVAAARAQQAAAESDLSTAQAERERYAGLLARKFVSQAAFEARDNASNAARARLEQARAQNQISSNQLDYGTLSSAFPAVVTAVLADAGQVVGAGQAVFRLARPEEKEVLIAVPEGRLGELKAARNLSVSLWADASAVVPGSVREIAPAADPATRTYAVRIRIENPPPEVRLGMTARVRLDEGKDGPLLVPLPAVSDLGKGATVWVAADGKVEPRLVQVLRFQENGALIGDGLRAGEMVVVAGSGKLVAGQAVEPMAAALAAQQR